MSSSRYLITGATGGLGSEILSTLLKLVPASQIIAGSSRAKESTLSTAAGTVELRQTDYSNLADLETAFQDVDYLFFVSSPIVDTATRMRGHANVVSAAKAAGVKHVWYSSLAFGGLGHTDNLLQQAHLQTEELLKNSGLVWTSVREGIYADAFPCFLTWFPTNPNQVLVLPESAKEGRWAYATRAELGEATAKLMFKAGHENEIVLLSGPVAYPILDLVPIINKVTGRNVTVKLVDDEEYVRWNVEHDEGGKSEQLFRVWLSIFKSAAKGEAEHVHPLMEEILGRRPKDGKQFVEEVLKEDPNYTWHQNYAKNLSH